MDDDSPIASVHRVSHELGHIADGVAEVWMGVHEVKQLSNRNLPRLTKVGAIRLINN